jgi:hypothetical protein
MKFISSKKWVLPMLALAITGLATTLWRTSLEAQTSQPQIITLKGRVIDLTCAVKGKVMTDSWNNVAEDHMMEDGNIQKACATLCLKGGQPAALFADNKITAIFACNPRGTDGAPHQGYTLAGYIAFAAEVEGYWADGKAESGIFVPLRIRRGILSAERRYSEGGGWKELYCGPIESKS